MMLAGPGGLDRLQEARFSMVWSEVEEWIEEVAPSTAPPSE
jgi:hypothetical protein